MQDLIDNVRLFASLSFFTDEFDGQFSIEGINKNRATMSPTKLDFLNRAHLQKKVQPGNEGARLELAARLKVLLLEKFSGRCVALAALLFNIG